MNLAEKLVALRKLKGLTQMELAEQLNVSRQAVSKWEIGAAVPSIDNLRTLRELYGVSVDHLLDDAEAIPAPSATPEPVQADSKPVRKQEMQKGLYLLALAIMVLMAITIGVAKLHESEQDRSVPMNEMTVDEGDEISNGYSEEFFTFD